jgi:PhoPQ-activated pathogenicity-related protein
MVAITINELPNCEVIFADDPEQKKRAEDTLLSYSMNMFLRAEGPEANPELYMIYPMAKAVL